MSAEYEPVIVGFVCNWCTFTAADLAGTSRLAYPPNIRLVRMMCSGMVDPKYVIKAFLEGADAVLIGGCWPGDCHYINGNMKARRRIALIKEIMQQYGIDEDRLWLRWIAASEGNMFAETVEDMVKIVKKLGPSQVREQMVI